MNESGDRLAYLLPIRRIAAHAAADFTGPAVALSYLLSGLGCRMARLSMGKDPQISGPTADPENDDLASETATHETWEASLSTTDSKSFLRLVVTESP